MNSINNAVHTDYLQTFTYLATTTTILATGAAGMNAANKNSAGSTPRTPLLVSRRAKQRDNGCSNSRCNMHWSGVNTDKKPSNFCQCSQFL